MIQEKKRIRKSIEKKGRVVLKTQLNSLNREIKNETLKVRNEEAISSSLRYKNFLNQLPPKEWIDDQ